MTTPLFRASARTVAGAPFDTDPTEFEACLSTVIVLDDGSELATSCFTVGRYDDADVALFHAQQAA